MRPNDNVRRGGAAQALCGPQVWSPGAVDSMLDPMQDADQVLDITDEICPMTFVRTRLALDRMQPGQVLLVKLRGDEPVRNVPRTAKEQGHAVVAMETTSDGVTLLRLRRGG
jgi:TusA-related sulfurtransferase